MNKLLISLLAVALLVGCAGKPRVGGPAPVESLRGPNAPSAPAPAPTPAKPAVDVYAYRAPAGAPAAPPPADPPKESGGSAGTMLALRSETPGPAPAPRASVTPKPQEVDPGLAPAIAWTPPPASAAAPKAPATPGATASSPPVPAVPPKTGLTANPAPPVSAPPKANAPVPVKPAPPPPPPPVVKYTAPPPAAPELPAAASSLAAQAEKQRERGDYVGAAATLERAIRIQPREAYLWNRLARVRLDQNNYDQAGSLAQKSNTLSKDQDQIKQDNWGMIAATRRAAGDQSGAEEAEAKAGAK